MDPSLYKAVKDGKVEDLDQYADLFDTQLTPNHNTILHVAAHFGKSECVTKILEKKPWLLLRVNSNCENPLHIAVREQHYGVVQALICGAKELDLDPESSGGTRLEMLRAINVDGDMPLHLAVREEDNSFVSLLANMDREFPHPPNKAGETPLYLAAEREHGDSMVESILASCESPAYTGPSGRTALHAAAINGNLESLKKLLARYAELIDKADTEGWTPLHYAAACGRERRPIGELLKRNKSVGYTRTSEEHDQSTALHLAAAADSSWIMDEILSHCPDCWEMVNSKGRNILHIAVDEEAEFVISYIIKKDWLLGSLMNQKDFKGNTPLHLLASSEMKYTDLINHRRANMYAFNNQNWTPAEVANTANKDLWSSKPKGKRNVAKKKAQENRRQGQKRIKEEKEKDEKFTVKEAESEVMKKTAESHMLVATLIATITFAAAFAIPGGYNGNQGPEEGMAVLVRQASFKAFVIANTIAVMCSTSSVIYYVFAALYPSGDEEQVRRYEKGFYLVIIAIMAMTVGFISGTYAMLVHSLGIAIATSVIASITFLIHFVELFRFLIPLAAMWLCSILCACCFGYVRVSPYRYASLRRRM